MKEQQESYTLVLAVNNSVTNAPCAICSSPTESAGVALFLAAERPVALVCSACGERHAPELVRASRLYAAFLRERERDESEPE